MKMVVNLLLSMVIIIMFILLTGCLIKGTRNSGSDVIASLDENNKKAKKDVLSETIWVDSEYKYAGFCFREDGTYYDWKIEMESDENGYHQLITGPFHNYTVNKNILTLFDMNLVIDKSKYTTVEDVDISFIISGKSMTWETEYDALPKSTFKRIETTIHNYAKNEFNIQVPNYGEN